MAFRGRRFVGLFTSTMTKTRYNLFSHSSLLPFSTLNNNHIINYNTNLDERFVLSQLTDLLLPLSIDRKNIVTDTQESRIMDDYLSPAEKLRGIFIHKLNGNAAIESALSGAGVSLNVEVVEEVVNRGNLGGEAMVVFFHWAIKQPAVKRDLFTCYKVVLKGLGRRKYLSFMEFFLQEMVEKRVGFDCEALFIVLDSYVRARLVVKAVKFFEGLEEFGLERGTESLNVLLECLCRRSHVGSASSVMSKMKGKIGFDCGTYNVVIGGWAKLGRVNEIERFMKEMVDDGLSPDCLTFSYFIEGIGRAGRIEDAVKVFGKLSENGCEADTTVYNAMISNFVSVREFDECMKYYKVMIEKGCSPGINTYTILINAFLKARRVADALELFDELLEKGIVPSTGTVTSFLEPLCRFGPPYAATVIYKKARKVGCELSLKAYKLLLMRLSRFGKCGMILTVWDDMQSCGYSSDMEVYEYVVNGLCNIGQLENAVLVMEEALRKGFCPGKIIYSKLNNKLLNVDKIERAYKLFLKVKDARRCENARRYWRSNGWHF